MIGFWDGSGISWTICKQSAPCSRQIITTPHHSVFYRLDALPDPQPTASKQYRGQYIWCCCRGSGPLQEFTRFTWWMQTQGQMAANPQTIWTVSPPIGCYHPHPPSPLPFYYYSAPKPILFYCHPTHFTIPQRVEGWVDLGIAVRVCSPCPRLYIAVTVMINTSVSVEFCIWVFSYCSRTC